MDLKRFEPVVQAIKEVRRTWPRRLGGEVDDEVVRFAKALGGRYGGTLPLSAASKILWLLYGDPVVIYDSRARKALDFRSRRPYPVFRAEWERRWAREAPRIAEACHDLPNVLRYAACGSRVSAEQVRRMAAKRWFRRRVLDVALWKEGE
jgi:hypothetical protein